jgi:thiamine-monophosphate kinase
MLTEFGLIDRFFTRQQTGFGRRARSEVGAPALAPTSNLPSHTALGIGDDCALLMPAPGKQLAISTDMLVAGRHFFADVEPHALGHKALAVNLSDLAAMGAQPRAFTLALALPEAREAWLQGFSDGLFALADRYGCELIGGDTTAGPLNICITVFGEIEPGHALTRDAARSGDDIWVSGQLGDARLALGAARQEWQVSEADLPGLRRALERPEPRIALGLALCGVAHAALDLSDGLAGDLQHILKRSSLTARVDIDALPRSAALARQTPEIQRLCTIAGGDDYELCFTAAPAMRERIAALSTTLALPLTRIGTLCDAVVLAAPQPPSARPRSLITWIDADGEPLPETLTHTFHGFDHFDAD